MRNLCLKFVISLLTFSVGAALILFPFDSKSIETVKAQSRPPEIPAPDDKIPEPPSDKDFLVIQTSKRRSSIRRIKGGGKFCEKFLLQKIAKESSADSRINRLKNFDSDDKILSLSVKKWLKYMRRDELLVAELRNNQQKALLLGSTSYGATGLATSLENWHIEISSLYSGEFWSFSKNPKLVFWDKEGSLNYYSVIYSDDFLSATSDRGYNNLTFNIERYKINIDGQALMVSEERNLKCQ